MMGVLERLAWVAVRHYVWQHNPTSVQLGRAVVVAARAVDEGKGHRRDLVRLLAELRSHRPDYGELDQMRAKYDGVYARKPICAQPRDRTPEVGECFSCGCAEGVPGRPTLCRSRSDFLEAARLAAEVAARSQFPAL